MTFGAAGPRDLGRGTYAYVGSAFGPGGLPSRIGRHRRVARGDHGVRHWHVDHLLGHPKASVAGVRRFAGRRIECEIAGSVPGSPVDGIGATDCGCRAHLVAFEAGVLERVADSLKALKDVS